jgi:hypothetical protein
MVAISVMVSKSYDTMTKILSQGLAGGRSFQCQIHPISGNSSSYFLDSRGAPDFGILCTYDQDPPTGKLGIPVRSRIHKPIVARLVVGSVTTSESLVLYVFFLQLFSPEDWCLLPWEIRLFIIA